MKWESKHEANINRAILCIAYTADVDRPDKCALYQSALWFACDHVRRELHESLNYDRPPLWARRFIDREEWIQVKIRRLHHRVVCPNCGDSLEESYAGFTIKKQMRTL